MADFDGDGDVDVVVASTTGHRVLLNDGTGAFAAGDSGAGGWDVVAADLDADGDVDIAVADAFNEVRVRLNQGDGTFTAGELYPAAQTNISVMSAGDFDGDGDHDLLGSSPGGGSVMLPGMGDGSFAAAVPLELWAAKDLVAADFDDDGDLDVATPLWHAYNLGGADFDEPVMHDLPGGPLAVAVADFNDDDKPDLAVAEGYGRVFVMLSEEGGLAAPNMFTASDGQDLRSIAAGDLNFDGRPDLAFTDTYTGWSSLLNGGAGWFGAVNTYNTWSAYNAIQAADLNGDGATDLAAVKSVFEGDNLVTVLFNCPA